MNKKKYIEKQKGYRILGNCTSLDLSQLCRCCKVLPGYYF